MAAAGFARTIAFTFDLHDVDLPEDVACASEWFASRGHAATFFVPSAMLAEPRYERVLRRLPEAGHEVASHGHHHDWNEIDALMGRCARLGFLAESYDRHAEFFGSPPTSFRSPRWCPLGPAAIERLRELGYVADSSATPQRLPLLSATPWHPGWWNCARGPRELRPGLVEVPTSTWLVPAGAPTFLTFRAAGTACFLWLLERESAGPLRSPLVLQFHVEDFSPGSRRVRAPGAFSWRDLGLRRRGGFRFKLFLRDTDPERIVRTHRGIVERYAAWSSRTITTIAREAISRSSA